MASLNMRINDDLKTRAYSELDRLGVANAPSVAVCG
jgi:antitoxin component of RelBE/YafQ-DinJ toxin-antitoxin module